MRGLVTAFAASLVLCACALATPPGEDDPPPGGGGDPDGAPPWTFTDAGPGASTDAAGGATADAQFDADPVPPPDAEPDATPPADAGPSGPIGKIVAGSDHTCALLGGGAVRCWGDGGDGRLGYASTDSVGDDEPASAGGDVNVGGAVAQIAPGGEHTCALLTAGDIVCWGNGEYGQLGYGSTASIGDDETPASAGTVDLGGTATKVVTGDRHSCALLTTGAVRCWGDSTWGQLGYGTTTRIGDDETPASAGDIDLGGTAVQLSAGAYHTCALLDTGGVRCWGDEILGYGNTEIIGDDETPASAGDIDVGGTVVLVEAGGYHTCAVLDTGGLRCWGWGISGKLGYASLEHIGDNEVPASAGDVDVGGAVVSVDPGGVHTCAVLATGAVRCWGSGVWGKLGYADTLHIGDDEPPAVAGDVDVGRAVLEVTTGKAHTCARLDDESVRCWGRAAKGALGYADTEDRGDDEAPSAIGSVPIL